MRFARKNNTLLLCGSALAIASLTLAAPVVSAELRLRQTIEPTGHVICLGELAEIGSVDEETQARLAALELFPRPPVGRERFVTLAEIQQALVTRGYGLAEFSFTGSSRVQVRSAPPRGTSPRPPAKVAPATQATSPALVRRAETLASQAIERYLAQRGGAAGWRVRATVDEASARAIAIGQHLTVVGDSPPATGRHTFTLQGTQGEASQTYSITAEVDLAPARVVAARNVARGTILGPGDLTLASADPTEVEAQGFTRLEDVVGREATRGLANGQLVTSDQVRSPILVRRGEPVTVWARAAGLRVRTTAVARDDGSLGDLVTVETRQNRQTFFARVSGPQEVDVYAHATTAATAAVATNQTSGAR